MVEHIIYPITCHMKGSYKYNYTVSMFQLKASTKCLADKIIGFLSFESISHKVVCTSWKARKHFSNLINLQD